MSGIDPALARALDRLEPPPMSDDFTARVLAATDGLDGALPPLPKNRPASRSLWRRSRGLVVGVAAFSLVSAAAAATGLLGERVQDLPVIAAIAAKIAPNHKHAPPKPQLAPPAIAAVPAQAVSAEPAAVLANDAVPVAATAARQEVRREAIAKWVTERRERRVAQGLPVASPRQVAAFRERLAEMPPAERRALLDRAIAARREARGGAAAGSERTAPAGTLREAIIQRREARAQTLPDVPPVATTAVPSPVPDAAATPLPVRTQQPSIERLRQLREQRERRREVRRQRGL